MRTIFLVALWSVIFSSGEQFKKFFENLKFSKNFLFLLLFFIFVHLITLLYSSNYTYGLSKLYGILFNLILNILALRFILVNSDKTLFKIFIEAILITGSVLTIITMLLGPFTSFYDENMQMKVLGIGLWSHVGFGRYMGLVFVIAVINLFHFDFFKKYYFNYFCFLISFSGLILSGLRGAIFSSLLISFLVITYSYQIVKRKNYKPKTSFTKLIFISFAALGLFLLAALLNNSFGILSSRFFQLSNIFNLTHLSDGAIATRLNVYLTFLQIFKENIFIGRGLGGYFDPALFYLTKGLKYPHNLLLEYAIEFGATGFALIIFLLFYILKTLSKINILLLLVFLYFVLISLFSFSIPFQTGLFAFTAFLFLKKEKIETSGYKYF